MREHVYVEGCEDGDCGGTCPSCCLSICKVCGNWEGALTTHCPDEISTDKSDAIYNGELDYRNGLWIENLVNRGRYWDSRKAIVNERKYIALLKKQEPLNIQAYKEARECLVQWEEIHFKRVTDVYD